MDVGTIVESAGLYATAFALLACVALAVELGRKPPKPRKPIPDETAEAQPQETAAKVTSSETKPEVKPTIEIPSRSFASTPAPPPPPPSDSVENTIIPVRPFDQVNVSNQVQQTGTEAMVAAQVQAQNDLQEALFAMQRTYVDGLLSSRGKYDVALAILNEYQTTNTMNVSEKDVGLTMATEAYLSATRTGNFNTSSRVPFLSNIMKGMLAAPEGADGDSDAASKKAARKTSETRKTSEIRKTSETRKLSESRKTSEIDSTEDKAAGDSARAPRSKPGSRSRTRTTDTKKPR